MLNRRFTNTIFDSSSEAGELSDSAEDKDISSREMWCALTILYFVLESLRLHQSEWRRRKAELTSTPSESIFSVAVNDIEQNLLVYLTETVAHLRWDDSIALPLTKVTGSIMNYLQC